MTRSAVILAGGSSQRLAQDKALLSIGRKPLIRHVMDVAERIVDDRVIAAGSQEQTDNYQRLFKSEATIVADKAQVHTPLAGIVAGFQEAKGDYVLLLPCDTPFLSMAILTLLFELSACKTAVVPRWPNCNIEPLQAVYQRRTSLEAATKVLAESKLTVQCMIDRLHGVRYISTLVLQQLDPELLTFFNINTPLDLKKAENILKKRSK